MRKPAACLWQLQSQWVVGEVMSPVWLPSTVKVCALRLLFWRFAVFKTSGYYDVSFDCTLNYFLCNWQVAQCGWAPYSSLRALVEQTGTEELGSLSAWFWSWDVGPFVLWVLVLLQPLIRTGNEITSLLSCRLSNYTMSLACRRQIMGRLSFHIAWANVFNKSLNF